MKNFSFLYYDENRIPRYTLIFLIYRSRRFRHTRNNYYLQQPTFPTGPPESSVSHV
jgi:hypothetical protein